MAIPKIVVVGGGHAASQLVSSLVQYKFASEITLVSEESWLPYQRPPLSKAALTTGLDIHALRIKPRSFYENKGIRLQLGQPVLAINRETRSVHFNNQQSISYDILVLATGSLPHKPAMPGMDLPGVFTLRNLDDSAALSERLRLEASNIILMGGGYIGLEVAASARKLGIKTTVVESSARLMGRSASPVLSQFLLEQHLQHGVDVRLGRAVTNLVGKKQLDGITLDDGSYLPCSTLLVGIGAQPRTELAQQAGLECQIGIIVDDYCRTSDSSIFAIGDCTSPVSATGESLPRLESVANAVSQARCAAAAIAGVPAPKLDVPYFWTEQYQFKIQVVGITSPDAVYHVEGNVEDESFSIFHCVGDELLSVESINQPQQFILAKTRLRQGK